MSIRMIKRNGDISVPTNKRFAVLTPTKKGIEIKYKDKLYENAYCMLIQEQIARIPMNIVLAYGLLENNREIQADLLDDGMFIHTIRKPKIVPTVPKSIKYKDKTLPLNLLEAISQKEVLYTGYKICVGEFLGSLGDNITISYHMKPGNMYIKIENDTEDCLELDELTEVFGRQLQLFDGELMRFSQKKPSSSIGPNKKFINKMGVYDGDVVRLYKMRDGSLVITPGYKRDSITKETMDPATQRVNKIAVCEEAHDSLPEVRELIGVIQDITKSLETKVKLIEKQSKMIDKLTNRIEELEDEQEVMKKKMNSADEIKKVLKEMKTALDDFNYEEFE